MGSLPCESMGGTCCSHTRCYRKLPHAKVWEPQLGGLRSVSMHMYILHCVCTRRVLSMFTGASCVVAASPQRKVALPWRLSLSAGRRSVLRDGGIFFLSSTPPLNATLARVSGCLRP